MVRNLTRYCQASSALRISASLTISIRGMPARLKSIRLASPWWNSLAVSSSRCTRLIRMRLGWPSASISRQPLTHRGMSYWEI